jgi:flagellar protein FlgJ
MIALPTSFSLGPKADAKQQLSQAATRFEAIFARQMLSAARQARFDKDGLFDSQATETFRHMMDDRFADILAEGGSLGFGKLIERQLASHVAPASAEGAKAKD